MFKILKEEKIVGISEESPVLLDEYDVEEDAEHTVDDYVQVNEEYVLKTSDEAVEAKQIEVRAVRNQYLEQTDKYMISDFPVSKVEKADYKAYRQYLRDYTEQEEWWTDKPLTFEEWKDEQ